MKKIVYIVLLVVTWISMYIAYQISGDMLIELFVGLVVCRLLLEIVNKVMGKSKKDSK